MFNYSAALTKDGESILVTFRDAPEAMTFGANKEEALLNAVDALETGLSFYVESRLALPLPGKPKRGEVTVSPTALECAKLGVYQAMTEQGI